MYFLLKWLISESQSAPDNARAAAAIAEKLLQAPALNRAGANQFLFRNVVYWVTINSANFPAASIRATPRRSGDDKSK